MFRIRSLFKWAVENEYARKQLFNGLSQKDDSQPDEDRALFQPRQLQQIFQTEIFTNNAIDKPFHYWSPLIALLTGMRQTEIAQLYLEDLRLDSGIFVFDINKKHPDKKLKNKYSKRLVPIHSFLLEAGIIQYRDKLMKEGHSRLFPELNFSVANGYGDDISDWFGKYRISVGIPPEGPVFHSFRHTVSTALMNEGVIEAIAAKLVGHVHKPMTFGTYGKKPIEVLKEMVEKLKFEVLKGIKPW